MSQLQYSCVPGGVWVHLSTCVQRYTQQNYSTYVCMVVWWSLLTSQYMCFKEHMSQIQYPFVPGAPLVESENISVHVLKFTQVTTLEFLCSQWAGGVCKHLSTCAQRNTCPNYSTPLFLVRRWWNLKTSQYMCSNVHMSQLQYFCLPGGLVASANISVHLLSNLIYD